MQAIRLEVIGVLKETKGESDFTMYVDLGEALRQPRPIRGSMERISAFATAELGGIRNPH